MSQPQCLDARQGARPLSAAGPHPGDKLAAALHPVDGDAGAGALLSPRSSSDVTLPAALTSLSHLTPGLRARLERHRARHGLQGGSSSTGITQHQVLLDQGADRVVTKRDAETITDVCSSAVLPEVEIISLLEEQIPRYRLRADTLTQFGGYENQDWFIPSPALKITDADIKLSPDQIRETLNYFILCSNRVSQMTKTYNDIEAVTRLLEEKEKDLELTARIGKELLVHNNKLEARVLELETEIKSSQDTLTQLTHELVKKTELIQVLTNDVDDSGSENGTPTGLRCINLELMHKRIGTLEEENKCLRREAAQLCDDTDQCEETEARLIKDFASQLTNATMDLDTLTDELDRQREENRLQHEQILHLTGKLAEANMKLHKFTLENEETSTLLSITKENQSSLAIELAEFKERYAEVMGLLQDTQEQLRRQRKRGMPAVRGGVMPSLVNANNGQPDSLQSELESSLYSEFSLDSGISGSDRVPAYKKVFETVRCASRASMGSMDTHSSLSSHSNLGTSQLYNNRGPQGYSNGGGLTLGGGLTMSSSVMSYSSQPKMSSTYQLTSATGVQRCGSSLYSGSIGYPCLDSAGQSDSEMHTDSEDSYPGAPQQGIPGVPGAADLEAALRRLTPAEVIARRATLSSGPAFGGYDYDGRMSPPLYNLPLGCRTPDSIMSTGSSGISRLSGHSSNGWKLPDKLQIVKPIEGSLTLHQWSQLATPTLSGLLDERPGVKIRGGRELDELGMELYTLSDLEEDEEVVHPGKSFQNSGCIYTYTNSTVLHPDDGTSVTHSRNTSLLASACTSRQATVPSTPACQTPRAMLSRRNSCSTFSTNMGLASMLNERGIKAVTPSCLNTPCGDSSFTPTATPCNSPDGSPCESRSNSPPPSLSGFLYSGADMLRRTFSGDDRPTRRSKRSSKLALSRSDKKTLTGIGIMEKVERIGFNTIMASSMASSMSPLPIQGGLYTRRHMTSPMAQLMCLKGVPVSSSASAERPYDDFRSSSTQANYEPKSISKKPPLPPSMHSTAHGAPAEPGSGALDDRLKQLQARQKMRRGAAGITRPDLGTVSATATNRPDQQSTLGTISSLLFGRKGGLL